MIAIIPMLRIDAVSDKQLKEFLGSLNNTDSELKYYDIQNDRIPETKLYINGAWDGDKLIGIGGLAVWYKCLPHLFFMIKEQYQGKGLGSRFSQLNAEYAKIHNLPFLFGAAKLRNSPSIKIVSKLGYKRVYDNGTNYFSILMINKKYLWVKYVLKIIVPIYCTRIGGIARYLRRKFNW